LVESQAVTLVVAGSNPAPDLFNLKEIFMTYVSEVTIFASSSDKKKGLLKKINDHFKHGDSFYVNHEGPFEECGRIIMGDINHLDVLPFFQHLENIEWIIPELFYMVIAQESDYQGTYVFGKFDRLVPAVSRGYGVSEYE
jgi:hypothetical protein